MKKLHIDLDGDLKDAIKELQVLSESLNKLPSVIANEAASTVTIPGYQGYPVQTEVTEEGGIATIVATGDQIGFNEYGSGIGAEYVEDAPIPTGYGSWSDSSINPEGKDILINKGYWYYNKRRLYGEIAAHAMTDTVQYLKEHGEELAVKAVEK